MANNTVWNTSLVLEVSFSTIILPLLAVAESNFLETTMIGDIDLDDFFPEEKLDSTSEGKSQEEMSRLTFEKSKEYAHRKYSADSARIHTLPRQYMFLEISKALRRKIQPLGK